MSCLSSAPFMRHLGAVGLLLLISGCGGDETPLYPATGTVQLQGVPVEFAVVAFVPVDKGSTAVAMTDDSGRFTVTTPPGRKGLAAGKYRVSVTKSSTSERPVEAVTFADMEREHKAGIQKKVIKPKAGVPPRYSDPATSQLEAEVKNSGKNDFTFELKG